QEENTHTHSLSLSLSLSLSPCLSWQTNRGVWSCSMTLLLCLLTWPDLTTHASHSPQRGMAYACLSLPLMSLSLSHSLSVSPSLSVCLSLSLSLSVSLPR